VFTPDPIELARWQLERDREASARFLGLFERKVARMAASPLALLRGAAPLFYRLLAEHPELSDGPDGEGWICGDAHVENFGVYRTSDKRRGDEEPVVFDVNDFDETVVAPWRFDVLRLVTSLVLAGRELGANGKQSLASSARLVAAYVDATSRGERTAPEPEIVSRLVDRVRRRTRRDLLDARTTVEAGHRRFVRGERYADLPRALEHAAREAFARYVEGLGSTERDHFEVQDLAFRIAGTGSLGCLRIAVLTRGKGGEDGAFLFDMKEQGAPSAAALVPVPEMDAAKRVLAGVSACVEKPPRMLGTTELRGSPMLVRRLSPQEDKLDLTRVDAKDLEPLAAHIGTLLGRAHRAGATKLPSSAWSHEEADALVDRAVSLAGLHEAIYLAFCKVA
jgi:uncharacterized protein (DUF2252 family)